MNYRSRLTSGHEGHGRSHVDLDVCPGLGSARPATDAQETGEMKRTSTASVLVGSAGARGCAGTAGLTSSATAGTLAHASKHKRKAKPKALSCKALISEELADQRRRRGHRHRARRATGRGGQSALRQTRTLEGHHARECDIISGRGPTTTETRRPTGARLLRHSLHLVRRDRRHHAGVQSGLRGREVNGRLGNVVGPPFVKQHVPSLGYGSRAFFTTNGDKGRGQQPEYQTDYGL